MDVCEPHTLGMYKCVGGSRKEGEGALERNGWWGEWLDREMRGGRGQWAADRRVPTYTNLWML